VVAEPLRTTKPAVAAKTPASSASARRGRPFNERVPVSVDFEVAVPHLSPAWW
jgi:hypothetical protein